jgi:hypothetical protein
MGIICVVYNSNRKNLATSASLNDIMYAYFMKILQELNELFQLVRDIRVQQSQIQMADISVCSVTFAL